jgi:hypothetical protein
MKSIFTFSLLLCLTACSTPNEPNTPTGSLPGASSMWQIAYVSNGGSTYLNMTGKDDSVNIVYKPCSNDATTSFHGYLRPIDPSEMWTGNIFQFKQVYFGRSDDGRLQYWLNGTKDSMITFFSSAGFYDYLLKRKSQ